MNNDRKTKNELIDELEYVRKKVKRLETMLKNRTHTKQDIAECKRAEEELKKSEEKYRGIFENVQDVYYESSFDGTILEISPSIKFISKGQYNRTDLIGKSMYDFYRDTNVRDTLVEVIQKAGSVTDFEVQLKNRDGSFVSCSTSAKLSYTAEGRPEKIIGSMHDISKRKQAEQELFIANKELLFQNEEKEKRAAELIIANKELLFQNEEKEKRAAELIIANKELLFQNEEKEKRAAELIIANKELLFQFEERKLAEEALRESETRYRSVLQSATDGIITVDSNGMIIGWNSGAERIFNYHYTEIVGQPLTSIIPLYHHDEHTNGIKGPQSEGDLDVIGKTVELVGLRKDKNVFPLELSLSTWEIKSEQFFTGIIRDITERKSLQSQILQTQKVQSIGTLAGGIAHDFNNILGIILAYSCILERSGTDEEKISKSTKAITQAVNRGAALVRQILTFARQTGAVVKPLLIQNLIRELVVMLQETFPEVIEFQMTLEKNTPFVDADQAQMHQVLLNLCVNARDAMPKGGIIGIEVKTITSETLVQQFPEAKSDRYVSIGVSDTGIGMDEATRVRIFDPFFTTKEQGKGTGLGLSVVYGIIQNHHGFISVESKIGQGTIFYLYLPVAQEDNKIQNVQKIRTEGMRGGSETILLVEDEELLREIVQSTLESNGYKVLIATNGQEAVDIYKRQYKNISIVLNDMGLPKLTGIDEFAMLKKINPSVKVIFASGFMSLETMSGLLKEGAKGFIQKPYRTDEVLQMVRDVLDEKESNKL